VIPKGSYKQYVNKMGITLTSDKVDALESIDPSTKLQTLLSDKAYPKSVSKRESIAESQELSKASLSESYSQINNVKMLTPGVTVSVVEKLNRSRNNLVQTEHSPRRDSNWIKHSLKSGDSGVIDEKRFNRFVAKDLES
jgi:hypothetical protein